MLYAEYIGLGLLALAVLYFLIRVGAIELIFNILGAILGGLGGGSGSSGGSSGGGFGGGSSGGGGASDDW